jgi:hypothetical protein
MDYAETKQKAHELIDRMGPGQMAAAVGALEAMVDPVARAIANAPFDDEPVSEEDRREIVEARAAFERGEGIPHEEILAEFGLTLDDWKRMGETPLEANGAAQ